MSATTNSAQHPDASSSGGALVPVAKAHGRPWVAAAARQVMWSLVTLLVMSAIIFGAVNFGKSPQALAQEAVGRGAPAAQTQAYIQANGLNESLPGRYWYWLRHFVVGQWGASPITHASIRGAVGPRLVRSLTLALVALALSTPIGILLGVGMAKRWSRPSDLGTSILMVCMSALPEFVVGSALIILFAVVFPVFPASSESAFTFGTTGQRLQAYVLPVATLTLVCIPYVARVARVAARDALTAPYTRSARLRGLRESTVTWDHAMRNAAVPIVNAVGLNLVYLLGSVVVVENVFAFPGLGQGLIQALSDGDVLTVQAIAMTLGTAFILISLVADVVVAYFNPRLRTGR